MNASTTDASGHTAEAPAEQLESTPAAAVSPDEEMRVLVLMRHAKAKPYSPAGDFERPLNRDGRAAARLAGHWLVAQKVRPDIAVVSPSVRTLQTWEELTRAGVRADDLWADKAIYNGGAEDIVESVNALPDDAHVVVVVGHYPGIPVLAAQLADHVPADSPHPDEGWPTSGVAIVSHPGSWESFPSAHTAVVAFTTPKRE